MSSLNNSQLEIFVSEKKYFDQMSWKRFVYIISVIRARPQLVKALFKV